jgi:hypothetical protein
MAKKKRHGGRKPKTLKEKKAEYEMKLERILRIASMFHNIARNKETRRKARCHVRKFEREIRIARDKTERETLKFLIKDYHSTADKMASFIIEDTKVMNKMVNDFKLNGVKKNGA